MDQAVGLRKKENNEIQMGSADSTAVSAPLSNSSLPRSAGAAAAARALAALVPGPAAAAGPARPVGTGAQAEPLFSGAAASSAARALTSLAGASARAASTRATPAAANGPMRVSLATSDGPDLDGPFFGPPPGTDDEASEGTDPGAVDSEVPQPDPQLDDILPAKSKSFFRLRR